MKWRMVHQDAATVERIVRQLDLVRIDPSEVLPERSDALRAKDRSSDWWPYARINWLKIIYVDRSTAGEITGRTPPNPRSRFTKVLWTDEEAKTAYFRAISY